jgi:hypothetical protein
MEEPVTFEDVDDVDAVVVVVVDDDDSCLL